MDKEWWKEIEGHLVKKQEVELEKENARQLKE